MLKQQYFHIPLLLLGCLLLACTSLDEVNERLDKLEEQVTELRSAVDALQEAYKDGKIYMTGPAREVFKGEINVQDK